MRKPIIVVGERRSGTSLISNILHSHGIWVGKCREADKFNKKGYFENIAFAALVAESHKKVDFLDRRKVKDILKKEGYTKGPWLVKHYVTFWYLWRQFSPIYVKVYREPDFIFNSLVRMDQTFNSEETREKITEKVTLLDYIPGIPVKTQEIINGDYKQIGKILMLVGLKLDKKIVESIIDKREWHYA